MALEIPNWTKKPWKVQLVWLPIAQRIPVSFGIGHVDKLKQRELHRSARAIPKSNRWYVLSRFFLSLDTVLRTNKLNRNEAKPENFGSKANNRCCVNVKPMLESWHLTRCGTLDVDEFSELYYIMYTFPNTNNFLFLLIQMYTQMTKRGR